MADYAQRRTQMVDSQIRPNDVTKFPVIDALLNVAREDFVPAGLREAAYVGENLPLSSGRVVLEPRSFGKLLDALDIQPGELVLDIGAGLGYSTAVLARLADAVVAVEDDAGMAAAAEKRVAAGGADNAAVVCAPLTAGAAKHGPYDVVIIEGGVEEVPAALLGQVKEGGRIAAIFMEDALGIARIGHMIDGQLAWRDVFNATAPVLPGFTRTPVFAF